MEKKRLYRSQTERMIWGVCGGLANYFNIDPTIIRIVFVLLIFANGLGILAYIILAIVVPKESSQVTVPKEVIKENVEELKESASELGREIRTTFAKEEGASEDVTKSRQHGPNILGIILIILGIFFLLASFNIFWWFRWGYLWPLILVAIGLLIILSARRR